ncbi:hypothetical protein VTJ83DRAFT_2905 [Remersonia thermophila]|uniref:Uncharacterized protein n=1 Tax=Remersonia thermophila TaxID=72144 RepID=A0ABR4DCI6_9PEZI
MVRRALHLRRSNSPTLIIDATSANAHLEPSHYASQPLDTPSEDMSPLPPLPPPTYDTMSSTATTPMGAPAAPGRSSGGAERGRLPLSRHHLSRRESVKNKSGKEGSETTTSSAASDVSTSA